MINQVLKDKILNFDKSKWKLTKLGTLAEDISVRVDKPGESVYDRFVGLDNFVSGDIKINSWSSTKNLTSSAKEFKAGDILFARRNAYLRRASLVDFNGCCSGDAFVIRENLDKVIPSFLAFLMNSNNLWDYANSNAAGTMSKRVKWRDLAEYEFLLPPKNEQAEFVKLLWSLDDNIECKKKLLTKQENLFLSYSNLIFSNDKGNEIELKNIGKLIMGQSPDGNSYNEAGIGMPFLQGNAEFGELNPIFTKYTSRPKKVVPENSILISVRAPVGDLNISDREYCIGRGLAGLYIENTSLRSYVYNFLKYSKRELDKRSTGTTFKAINKDVLSSLKLVIPFENELIVNSNNLEKILNTIDKMNSNIIACKALKKSVINLLF